MSVNNTHIAVVLKHHATFTPLLDCICRNMDIAITFSNEQARRFNQNSHSILQDIHTEKITPVNIYHMLHVLRSSFIKRDSLILLDQPRAQLPITAITIFKAQGSFFRIYVELQSRAMPNLLVIKLHHVTKSRL